MSTDDKTEHNKTLQSVGLGEEAEAEIRDEVATFIAAVERRDPEAAKTAVLQIVRTTRISSGPLPAPEMLEHYQQILPNAAERIFVIFEKEAEHRHRFEMRELEERAKLQHRLLDLKSWGQRFALITVLAGMATAAWALYLGHPAAASIIGGASLAAIVGAFLYSRREAKYQKEAEAAEEADNTVER